MYDMEQIKKNLDARKAVYIDGEDGGKGTLSYRGTIFKFQFSNGMGWDHVSVSTQKRCPTWEEMCLFKYIFWPDSEACIQYHPAKQDYVNNHKYCLHLWRPQTEQIPKPLLAMV